MATYDSSVISNLTEVSAMRVALPVQLSAEGDLRLRILYKRK